MTQKESPFGPGTEKNPVADLNAESAAISDPSVSPRGADMGAAVTEPNTLSNKTKILEVGEEITWTTEDIYWPSIIDAEAVVGDSALDTYHLYYSTDHSTGSIALASAPHPLGPWTDYGSNPIFEPFTGEQNETPSVVPDGEGGLLMFMHTTDGSGPLRQSTAVATSSDGTSWSIHDFVDNPSYSWMDHNGYFRPIRTGSGWFAYHLFRANNNPLFGTSTSDDGLSWDTNPEPLGRSTDLTPNNNRRIEWNTTNVLNLNGALWWVGLTKDQSVSGTDRGKSKIAVAPFDGPRNIGKAKIIGKPTESFEGTSLYSPWAFSAEGKAWVAYATDSSKLAIADMGRTF